MNSEVMVSELMDTEHKNSDIKNNTQKEVFRETIYFKG